MAAQAKAAQAKMDRAKVDLVARMFHATAVRVDRVVLPMERGFPMAVVPTVIGAVPMVLRPAAVGVALATVVQAAQMVLQASVSAAPADSAAEAVAARSGKSSRPQWPASSISRASRRSN